MLVLTAAAMEPLTVPCAAVIVGKRAQAREITGPIGHAWSALADVVVLWGRYLAHRARRRA